MKKIIMCLLLCLVGCSKPSIYSEYVELLQNKEASITIPFDVNIYMDSVNEEENIYQIVIDNVKEELTNVKALVIHDQKTKDIFPSIGIVDDPITLNEQQKGINLVGYVKKGKNITFKVLIEVNQKQYIWVTKM